MVETVEMVKNSESKSCKDCKALGDQNIRKMVETEEKVDMVDALEIVHRCRNGRQ